MAASLDLRATRLDLANEDTDATSIAITFVDDAGAPVDLSGWTFTAPIMTLGGGEAGTNFSVGVNANLVTLNIAADTLDRGSYLWGLVATVDGAPTTWLGGSFLVGNRGSTARRAGSAVTVQVDAGVTVNATINVGGVPDLQAEVDALEARVAALEALNILVLGG